MSGLLLIPLIGVGAIGAVGGAILQVVLRVSGFSLLWRGVIQGGMAILGYNMYQKATDSKAAIVGGVLCACGTMGITEGLYYDLLQFLYRKVHELLGGWGIVAVVGVLWAGAMKIHLAQEQRKKEDLEDRRQQNEKERERKRLLGENQAVSDGEY